MSSQSKLNHQGSEDSSQCSHLPAYLDLDSSATLKEPVNLQIQGSIPQWLTGSLYRNGSGVYKVGDDQFKHLFDGFAVLSRWTIKDGQVSFLSTVLDSESYNKSQKLNKIAGSAFGTYFPDPCRTIFNLHNTGFVPLPVTTADNTSVNIFKFADKIFAVTESAVLQEVNPDSLLRNETIDIGERAVIHMGTAHPYLDPDDGSLIYFGSYFANYAKAFKFLRVTAEIPPGETNPFTKAQLIGSIKSRWKIHIGYTHSFGVTKNYIVHFELPLAFNSLKAFTVGMTREALESAMKIYPDEPIKIHVMNKITGERIPIDYYAPHGFVFHFINCYEDRGFIVCDVCLYDNCHIIKELYLDELMRVQRGRIPFKGRFARFVLPLSLEGAQKGKNLVTLPGSAAKATIRGRGNSVDVLRDVSFFDEVYFEMPRINSEYSTKNYRYIYGCSSFNQGRLVKLDISTKKVLEWRCGDTHFPGEPVFVKSPNAEKEDDGIILSTIIALSTEHSSFLLVLDASTFEEIGRAVVPASIKLNFSLHGDFYENQCSDKPT